MTPFKTRDGVRILTPATKPTHFTNRQIAKTIAALAVVASVSGCSHLERILRGAAADRGTAEARVVLPDWPADCAVRESHAPLVVGSEIRSILKRERSALNRANARVGRCAEFYSSLKAGIK